jgi:hypothetical protein
VLISCIEIISRRRCISQRRLPCHLQCQRPCRFLRRAGPCADGRAATRAYCSAVPRARRLPYYFRRRRSWRCWPRRPSLPAPTAELPLAPVFVPLPVPTTEHISRGSSLVLISCIERTSRRRCLSQRRLSCHLQCQRPCRFLRRAGPCADGRAATRAYCSAVPRARRLPYYFRRRRSWRCWPRRPSLPAPTAELPPAPVFVPLPVPTTEHISRGSSLHLVH